MEHRTFLVFLPEHGPAVPIVQHEYARLLAGDARFPEFASQCVRIADWYVEMRDRRPGSLVGQTYSKLRFDHRGSVAEIGPEASWLPSDDDRALLQELLYVVCSAGA